MPRPNRVELARASYERAVRAARAQSSPASWRRLVRASRNLRAAREDLPPRARPDLILVVEDDAAVRAGMRELLERRGYEVRDAVDGRAALVALETERLRPRLVLLDLGLPVVSGLQVLERMRRDPELAQIPVLVVSGSELDPRPVAPKLAKPIQPERLIAALEDLAGR